MKLYGSILDTATDLILSEQFSSGCVNQINQLIEKIWPESVIRLCSKVRVSK